MDGRSSRERRRFLDEQFRAVVGASRDRSALQLLREHAAAFRAYLMSNDGRATIADLESDADLDWLHEVYVALSEVAEERQSDGLREDRAAYSLGEAPPPRWALGDLEESSETTHPSDREDALVGQAFEKLLVHGLPPNLVDIDRFFAGVRPAGAKIQMALRTTASVAAAGPVAHQLARYGITPVLVVNASQAVATAARRHYRVHRLPRDRGVVIDDRSVCNDPESATMLRRGPLCEGVRLATELAQPVSDRLFDWLTGVARCKPLLFDRFRAREVSTGLLLEPTAERVDLVTAWQTTAPGVRSERSDSR